MATRKQLNKLMASQNIADSLDEEELAKIARTVIDEYEDDLSSRMEWQTTADKVLKQAKLQLERKTWPFDGASNAKYPLLTTAIIHYASKTYPEIVRDGKVVHCAVVGKDEDGSKAERAKRISEFMSYQLLIESSSWEDHMDRLLHTYPVVGVAFKKTYFNPTTNKNDSILCLHDEIIVNDNIPSLEEALRVTHIIKLSKNSIIENMRAGYFLDMDMEELDKYIPDKEDYIEFLEQHRYLDLDDDDYAEPYIVTVHKDSGKVFRIGARFDPDGITYNKKDEVQKITPVQYFTDFHCIPRPDGKYHSIGLGTLLYHPTEIINSLINRLIDAGTLASMQGGFIAADVEVPKGGFQPLALGEWRRLKSTSGQSLKESVMPLNYQEPSSTLYHLLELMIDAARRLSSITDVMTGQENPQNVKAHTIDVLNEGSQVVLSSIKRRLYRSLKSEFEKLYRLNRIYLDELQYVTVMDDNLAVLRSDYDDKGLDVRPVSDPNLSSDTQKMQQAQFLGQFVQFPFMNQQSLVMRMLNAANIPNPEDLFAKPGQQSPMPNPAMMQMQLDQQKHQDEMQMKDRELTIKEQLAAMQASKIDSENQKNQAMAMNSMGQAAKTRHDSILAQNKFKLDAEKLKLDALDRVLQARNIDNAGP